MSRSLSSARRLLCLLALCTPWTSSTASAQTPPAAEPPPAAEAPPVADVPPAAEVPSPAAPPAAEPTPGQPAPADAAPGVPQEAPAPAEPTPAPATPPQPVVEPAPPSAEPPAAAESQAPVAPASDAPPALGEAAAAPAAPIEVTIVGTRLARTPGSAHVIRSKELERFEYDDPTAVLTSVPGVYTRTEDGMGLRPNIGIRGVDPDRSKKVTLMEDGVLFGPAPYSAPAAYYFPIITRMTQVRVVKGPSAVAHGPQTVGGAIDLITRSIPTTPSGGLDLAAGQFGYGKGHAYFGASNEQFGYLVEGVRLQNSGFKELMTDKDADTGFVRNEWMAKFNYVVDPDAAVRNEFRLKLGYSDEVSNETYLGLSEQDFDENPYARYGASALDRMTNHHTSVALTHQVDFTPRITLTTTAYRNDFTRVWRRVDNIAGANTFDVLNNVASDGGRATQMQREQYLDVLRGTSTFEDELGAQTAAEVVLANNQRTFVSEGLQSTLRWEAETGALSHRLEAGLRVHYDRIERRHSADGFDLLQGELYPDGDRTKVTALNKAATYAFAPHVLYALTFKGLTVTPGLRTELMRMSFVDRMPDGVDTRNFSYAVLPGLGLYYALTEELGLLAGAYRGFSAAPPDAGKDAKPENSINYEVGTRYTKGALRAEAIGFYNDYTNLTTICSGGEGGDVCNSSTQDTQYSAGAARIYGVEVLAGHDIPAGPVKVPVTLAYTRTQAQFGETFTSGNPLWGSVEKGDFIPNVPKHQLRASAGVDGKPAGGAVAFTYVAATGDGSTGTGADHRELRTDSQYVFDASAWVAVWGPFKAYATAQNLLDSTYVVSHRPFGMRPNAPRWIHVGVKAAF